MSITTANPQFERFPHVQFNDPLSYVIVNYKPAGYWSDTAVSLRINFEPLSLRMKSEANCMCENLAVEFSVSFASGGQDSKMGIDPITTIENFHAALTDALGIIKHVKERAKNGATYHDLTKELASLDLPTPEVVEGSIVFVSIGDNKVAGNDIVFLNEEAAKSWVERNFKEGTPQVVFREASQREENYWWALIQTRYLTINPYFSCLHHHSMSMQDMEKWVQDAIDSQEKTL
jgi:hypothetical protein